MRKMVGHLRKRRWMLENDETYKFCQFALLGSEYKFVRDFTFIYLLSSRVMRNTKLTVFAGVEIYIVTDRAGRCVIENSSSLPLSVLAALTVVNFLFLSSTILSVSATATPFWNPVIITLTKWCRN